MKYLVTGGAGFIGSNIAIRLVKDGHSVRVVDNLVTGRRHNLSEVADDIEFIEGSVTEPSLVEKAVAGVDGIFHQAAVPSVPRSVANPRESHNAIVDGTLTILEALRLQGGGRLVAASSSSVYGDTPSLPKQEDMRPNPLSPYAVAKLVVEHYGSVYNRLYGVEVLQLRYFNVFGPNQDPKSEYAAVIPKFVTAALEDRRPVIYGDGEQSRDFTYVENVVEANLKAMNSSVGSAIMNIAGGRQITLLELVARIGKLLGKEISPILEPPRRGDIKHSFADVARAKELIGFETTVDVDEGLRRTIEYFREKVGTKK